MVNIRSEYEARRQNGNLTKDEEIAFLKKQIKALENQLNASDVLRAKNDTLKLEKKHGENVKLEADNKMKQNQQPAETSAKAAAKSAAINKTLLASNIAPETSTDVDYLQKKVNDLQSQLYDLDKNHNRLSTENESRRRKSSERSSNAQLQKKSIEFDRVVEEKERLRMQLDKMIGIEDKLLKLKALADASESYQKEMKRLENEKKIVEADLAEAIKKINELNGKILEYDGTIKTLENENVIYFFVINISK